jgi:hypothetical protein
VGAVKRKSVRLGVMIPLDGSSELVCESGSLRIPDQTWRSEAEAELRERYGLIDIAEVGLA